VERLEKDVDEWHHLSSLGLDSSVDEELECLIAQMREAHFAAEEAAKAISSNLKSLKTRRVKIGDAIALFLMPRIKLRRLKK